MWEHSNAYKFRCILLNVVYGHFSFTFCIIYGSTNLRNTMRMSTVLEINRTATTAA